MKMVQKAQVKMVESDKKMKNMTTAIQNITKEPPRKDGEIRRNEERESNERKEEDRMKNEEKL